MSSPCRFLLCLIAAGLFFRPDLARTEFRPLHVLEREGAALNCPHESIRLESQEVIIQLAKLTYTVDAVFHFFNSGKRTIEWLGFPKRRNPVGGRCGTLAFIPFDVWIDDRKINVSEIQSANDQQRPGTDLSQQARLVVRAVVFPDHARTTIRVRYEETYDRCGPDCMVGGFAYGSGRCWKDPIGKAVFIIDSSQVGGLELVDVAFSRTETQKYSIRRRPISNDVVRYEIRDFEPELCSALFVEFNPILIGAEERYVLPLAAGNGRLGMVRALLRKGTDVNAVGGFGQTPLMAAARGGYVEVVKLLLANGADVNAKSKRGDTALKQVMEALWPGTGKVEMAKLLRDHGAKPSTLAVAAWLVDMEAVQRLLAEGANVNEKGRFDGSTPLMAAAMGGQADVLTFLLDRGAKVDARNQSGETALMMSASGGYTNVVHMLLAKGADVNGKDAHRDSGLYFAASRGHVETVRVLLEKGADINARNSPADRTILMHTAQRGHLEVVKLLLDEGADVNAVDNAGRTALSLAREKPIEEIERLLKAQGATE